ncbi:Arc family DNA-binding protein [Streptosporangium sp. NPDC000563]|uniref:FitA-like ribbon-helix-helix domain-containing protein n=1 Tax=Streptosporangium sp. NPDC000563 TaxID=3154366 RepID=UPI003318A995
MESEKRITLRIPDDLHTRLVARAGRQRRSLNSEILCLLEDGLAADHDGSTAPAPPRGRPDSSPA